MDRTLTFRRLVDDAGFRSLGTFADPEGPCRLVALDRTAVVDG